MPFMLRPGDNDIRFGWVWHVELYIGKARRWRWGWAFGFAQIRRQRPVQGTWKYMELGVHESPNIATATREKKKKEEKRKSRLDISKRILVGYFYLTKIN